MRFTSAPLFKSAVLYGLLAAAHALPTSIAPKDEKRRSLDLRMVPVKPLTPKPVAKPPPSRPAGSPHDGPEVAPPPRLGADPVAPGSGDNTRLDGKPKKDIAVSGADNLKALDNKLKESPVKSRDFKDYDAKIGKYTVDEYKPFEFSVSPDKAKWYTDNGIPSEPGPEVKGVDIYGAKNVDLDAPDLAPAWSGAVDPVNGVQIRNGEFRTGQAGNMKADDYYRDIPEKERIFISDIIARNQKDYGGGRPMSKNVVTGIVSDDMKPFLTKVIQDKGNPATISPNDPEWPSIMGGSAGAPLTRALTDHPDVFHNYKPTSVSVYQSGGMIDAIFSLGP